MLRASIFLVAVWRILGLLWVHDPYGMWPWALVIVACIGWWYADDRLDQSEQRWELPDRPHVPRETSR